MVLRLLLYIQALTSCVTLGQSFQPQFPQVQNGENTSTYVLGFVWGLNETTHRQHLAQYTAHGKDVSHHSKSAAVAYFQQQLFSEVRSRYLS